VLGKRLCVTEDPLDVSNVGKLCAGLLGLKKYDQAFSCASKYVDPDVVKG
jgi:hypothetical protein